MKREEIENRERVMKIKKEKFIEAVVNSADSLGFPIPKIKFWEVYDSKHFTSGERAHIHLDTNTICISEPELEVMNFQEIEHTASHEVSHLLNRTHDVEFQNLQSDTEKSLWTPPTGEGIIAIDNKGSSPIKEKKPKRKARVIKSRCNYHLCYKRGKTYKCKYCKRYYCKKHKKPVEPDFSASFSVGELKGHPCLAYFNHLIDERKKQDGEYEESLRQLSKSRRKEWEEDVHEESLKQQSKVREKEGEEDIYEESMKRLKDKEEERGKESVWEKLKRFFRS